MRQYNASEIARILDARPAGPNGWMARCPAHDDRKPSLSIKDAGNGRTLIHCHAGCAPKQILKAMGLEMADLFPEKRKATIAARYVYLDDQNQEVLRVTRLEPKGFYQEGYRNGAWDKAAPKGKLLYRLPEIMKNSKKPVYVVEGERDADRLAGLSLLATTNPGGAGKWRREYSKTLTGRSVRIIPDADSPGQKHAVQVVESLLEHGCRVQVVELPDVKDVSDWLDAGHTQRELVRLARGTPDLTADGLAELRRRWGLDDSVLGQGRNGERKTQAQKLIELIKDAELWHSPDLTPYATMKIGGRRETWPVRSRLFKLWLDKRFYECENKPAGTMPLNEALNCIEAKASLKGAQHEVFIRVAAAGGKIYLDLANDQWQAVEIDANGWSTISDAPVKFRRTKAMQPLPVPISGGDLDDLKELCNVDDTGLILIVSWLLSALRGQGPFPVLEVLGEQGSAKSTSARILRFLVDPNTAPLRWMPRNERDLAIAARNAWALVFDNLSRLSDSTSDAICRLATGGGFSTRRLYTDGEEEIFDSKRPVILNGIVDVATRTDLIDRCLVLTLKSIPEKARKTEEEINACLDAKRPELLGALLDAVAEGLRSYENTKLAKLPRMADFARWMVACEKALPWESGRFIEVYAANRQSVVEESVEADLVASAVRRLMERKAEWIGSARDLLSELDEFVPERAKKTRQWPQAANWMTRRLKQSATFLRLVGIDCQFAQGRVDIKKVDRNTSDTSDASEIVPVKGVVDTRQPVKYRSDSPADTSASNSLQDSRLPSKRGNRSILRTSSKRRRRPKRSFRSE